MTTIFSSNEFHRPNEWFDYYGVELIDFISSNCSAGVLKKEDGKYTAITDYDEFAKILKEPPQFLDYGDGVMDYVFKGEEKILHIVKVTERGAEWLDNHGIANERDYIHFICNPNLSLPCPNIFFCEDELPF